MKALFLPYYDDNPYQDELAAGLEERGVEVVTGDYESTFPVLRAIADHGTPDVIHLHWAHPLLVTPYRPVSALFGLRMFVELAVAQALGVRVVWTVHNRLSHDASQPALERRLRGTLADRVDAVVVHSRRAREVVMDTYRVEDTRVHVVPQGNYVEAYPNDVSRADARDRLDLSSEATVFLFFGNVRPYKNVPALVEAFRELDDSTAELLVVGRPPTDNEAQAVLRAKCAAHDGVHTVFEFVPDDEIQWYLNAADAVVLPFREVLTSGSAVLALSFGRPVVAPRLGTIPDLVGEADELLYDPGTDAGLDRALDRALDTDLDAMGAHFQRRVARFGWDRIAARTERVYRGESLPALERSRSVASAVEASR